jgi:hypothetical protein
MLVKVLVPYTQQTAEQDIFNLPGGAAAAEKRRKLSELETASFGGKAGMGAIARDALALSKQTKPATRTTGLVERQ